MHGYFIDVRLYRKAKSAAEPFNFEQYKKKKIKEKIDEEKSNRVKIQVNEYFIEIFDSSRNIKHIYYFFRKRYLRLINL